MRLLQKELLLYNDSYDNWETIYPDTLGYNTHLSNNSDLFTVSTTDGEFLQSKEGVDYKLKQAKLSSGEVFNEYVEKVIGAYGTNGRYKDRYLVLTQDKKLYFSYDNLKTLRYQKTYNEALDIAYGGGLFVVVGENGFYATGELNSAGTNLTWFKQSSFTSRNIHKIKYFEDKHQFVVLDYAYADNFTFVNTVYTKSTIGSSGWTKVYEETTAGTGWKLMNDITYRGSKLIAIRSDNVLNLHNVSDNVAYTYNNIPFEGSGIIHAGNYIILCAKDGQLAVTSHTSSLDDWKLFTMYDNDENELYFEYITYNPETNDIVAMDSNYLVHINKKLLDKLMEL